MKISLKSLREQGCELRLQKIHNGHLAPGDRVNESRLAKQIGVSTIPVREAVRELVARGVLVSAAHKGARVREVNMVEALDALSVRSALEPLAVRLAGERLLFLTAELKLVANSIVVAARMRNFVSFQRHNETFHRAIFEATENRLLLRIYDLLVTEGRARAIMDFLKVDPIGIAKDHEHVVDALEAGDLKQAASLLASHDDRLTDYLRRQLDDNGEGKHPQHPRPRASRAAAARVSASNSDEVLP
jgi:DNA-binding GntR family transcriptional regulator